MLSTKKIVLVAFLGLAVTQVSASDADPATKGDIAALTVLIERMQAGITAANAPGRFSKAASTVTGTVSSRYESACDFLKKPRVLPVINKEVTVGVGLGVAAAVAGVVVVGKQGYLNRPVVATKGFLSGAWARVPAMPRLWGKKAN